MKKILLGTLAFNNSDLLEKCIKSWPKEIDKCVLFQGNKSEMNEVYKSYYHYNFNHFFLFKRINNWGVAGGWNIILRKAFYEYEFDGVILVGSDTEMLSEFFENFIDGLEDYDFVESTHQFNCFYISKKCFETVGSFDINFYPCYCEDDDYRIRIIKSGVRYKKDHGIHNLFNHVGSASVKSLNEIEKFRAYKSFQLNKEYMERKWGGSQFSVPKWKPIFETPFNNPDWPLNYWKLEPENRIKRLWDNIYSDEGDDRLIPLLKALNGEGFYNSDT